MPPSSALAQLDSSSWSEAGSLYPSLAAAILARLTQLKKQVAAVVVMDGSGSEVAREVAGALRQAGMDKAGIMEVGRGLASPNNFSRR